MNVILMTTHHQGDIKMYTLSSMCIKRERRAVKKRPSKGGHIKYYWGKRLHPCEQGDHPTLRYIVFHYTTFLALRKS
ncbi:hypothetical protein OUZ56_005492 [Daphnia magna]|uniref:Uncharacterized protein n=1 Tax=Daphnia magna TaxID=35525 RepID=A0ABQ9YSX7_9CRUS|nr:hypothetical protein OUZ56_005492 [Daphnia magna]